MSNSVGESGHSQKALITLTYRDQPPTLAQAAEELGLEVTELDTDFGVVELDSERGTYGVEVDIDRLPADFEKRRPFQGPYSSPPIEHFGPVETASDSDDAS